MKGLKSVSLVVRASFEAIFDVILPLRARAARTQKRRVSHFHVSPTSHSLHAESITTLLAYQDPVVADMIRALKYERSNHAAKICAVIISDYLREEIASLRAFSPRPILLVPVPLHAERVRERGFNQIEKILKHFPEEFRNGALSKVELHALSRTRHTTQQTRLSREERIKNVVGAFAADREAVRGTHVILIDDVTTTGATISECARALREVGARVTSIALARA